MSDNRTKRVHASILRVSKMKPTAEDTRRALHARRLETLYALTPEIKQQERRALHLLKAPRYPHIIPTLHRVNVKDRPLWKYLRIILSTAPYRGRGGRQGTFFCIDKKSGGILGIVECNSDLQTLAPRDRLIGWTRETKYRRGGLGRVIGMGTCVSAQPFGWLCGGKYISEAVSTDLIASWWTEKYHDVPGMVCTTSLYGRASQYNRLPSWDYLGTTQNAVPHGHLTRPEIVDLMQYFYQSRLKARAGGYGNIKENLRDVFLAVAADLKIKPKTFQGAGDPRGVYVSELYPGALVDMQTNTTPSQYEYRRHDEVASWWVDRWCNMRWPKVQDRIALFDWSAYSVNGAMRLSKNGARRPVEGATYPVVAGGAEPTSALHSR
mgnify:CR=1 FL=1